MLNPNRKVYENLRFYDVNPILVIDDNVINQKVTSAFLKDMGINTIDTATTGQEGIDLYKNNDYSLVLLDICMPNLNGLDACKIIKSIPNKKTVPVIAVTSLSEEIIEDCKLAGFSDYIRKPLELNTFKGIIKKWIINK